MEIKRKIVDTNNGPALVEYFAGIGVEVIGTTASSEIDADEQIWADLNKKLKTGKLDFATVKKEHGISRKNN